LKIKNVELRKMPRVSVILPVYNAEIFIEEAVKSILDQTFSDFELILLNDCSTDSTPDILEKFTDHRIRFINNDTNLKVVKTLNKGLDLATGEFIARMDADDIAHPLRLEKQVNFLTKHPETDLVGSWVQHFGAESTVMKAATEHDHIKVRLFFVNPMFHPAVMFRNERFKKNNLRYEESFKNAEDYGLWVKAIDTLKFANIPEILLKYRIHAANVSVLKDSNRSLLDEIHYDVYRFFLDKLNVDFTGKELLMQRKLGLVNVGELSQDELTDYLMWLKKLVVANSKVNYFDKVFFRNVILSYILYVTKMASPGGASLKQAIKIFGSLYNARDFAVFLVSRARVKLHKVETF
jgi:glycosyltransferase involved in cell wall biosynthesis